MIHLTNAHAWWSIIFPLLIYSSPSFMSLIYHTRQQTSTNTPIPLDLSSNCMQKTFRREWSNTKSSYVSQWLSKLEFTGSLLKTIHLRKRVHVKLKSKTATTFFKIKGYCSILSGQFKSQKWLKFFVREMTEMVREIQNWLVGRPAWRMTLIWVCTQVNISLCVWSDLRTEAAATQPTKQQKETQHVRVYLKQIGTTVGMHHQFQPVCH